MPIWRVTGPGRVPELPQPRGPILVTGAAGFVGGHLIRALHAAWPEVSVVTPAIDVRDAAAVADAIRMAQPACCVHLAAIASIPQAAADQDAAWQVNLHGTLNVAAAIAAHAPDCQMLFVSSADAYGASFKGSVALTEAAPLAPMNVYGATKAAADLALGSLAYQGLRVVRMRPFNHSGMGQAPEFVLASFARQIARIEAGLQPPEVQVGRLDTMRDFLDVRDVCAAYLACIARPEALPPGTILNIASGTPRRVGGVLESLLAMSPAAITVRGQDGRVRDTDIMSAAGNAGLAQSLLGWRPMIAWDDTLNSVLSDWRARVAAGAP